MHNDLSAIYISRVIIFHIGPQPETQVISYQLQAYVIEYKSIYCHVVIIFATKI